jgi:hypothetical protein
MENVMSIKTQSVPTTLCAIRITQDQRVQSVTKNKDFFLPNNTNV